MKPIIVLIIALLLAPLALLQAADVAKPKPNIIFVLFDDVGYGQPKCYREGTEFKTPNIGLLARECMRIDSAEDSFISARIIHSLNHPIPTKS